MITKYHLEASIAYWHTVDSENPEKWVNILKLYDKLLHLEYSPIASLNRTYALYRANGREEAIVEAEKLKLTDNYFYFVLLGELYSPINKKKAKYYLKKALLLAKSEINKEEILTMISNLE